jgi:hypothetical protein
MDSWRLRLKKYNEENNIVTLQKGGNSDADKIPEFNDEYYNNIILNNKSYSLKDKTTVQLIKKIINYYNQNN